MTVDVLAAIAAAATADHAHAADIPSAAAPSSSDTTPSPAAPLTGRNARGQFALGNPGGPGRPPKIAHLERELLAFMARVVGPEIWMRVTEAVALKAMEGNMAAVNWLTRVFLSGGLSKAAAADAVEISPQAEMFALGQKQHPEWSRAMKQKIEEELDREAAAVVQAMSQPPAAGAADHDEETAPSQTVTSPGAEPHRRPASPASAPQHPLVVPTSERVQGFRVTKGPRPAENGRNRSKNGVSHPVSAS